MIFFIPGDRLKSGRHDDDLQRFWHPVSRMLKLQFSAQLGLIMKLTFFLTTLVVMNVFASSYSQTVTYTGKDVPLEKVFSSIKKQTGYVFFYNFSLLRSAKPVTLNVVKAELSEVLLLCFRDQPFDYSIENKTIVIAQRISPGKEAKTTAALPPKELKGRVTDAKGQPLPGATVKVKETGKAVMTNAQGEFELKNVDDKAVLIVSFIGYKQKEIALKGASELHIVLEENLGSLEQIVVMAYGTAKKKDIAGSIASLGQKEVQNAPMGSTIQSLLQGKASGVNVAIQSASPTSPISVVIRGASSLSGNNQPLWVIDGVPDYSTATSGNIANSLYNLNLNDVESIDILKDASATALYGSRAANGVVIVSTKRGKEGMNPTIEVSTRFGYQRQDFNGYKYMEGPEYEHFADIAARAEVMNQGGFDYFTRLFLDEQAFFSLNTSEFKASDLKKLKGAYYEGNTNWMKEMTRNPLTQQHDVSLRGGTKNIAYYVSLNNTNMDGIVKTGGSKLYGGRLNLEAKLRKGFKFGLNLSGSTRNTNNKDYMLDVLKKIRPDIPVYNPDGTLFTKDAYTENPYTTLLNTRSGSGQLFNGTGFLEYSILDGLLLRTAYTANYANTQRLDYDRRGSTFNTEGSRSWSNNKNQTSVWENTLTYAKTFGKHDVLGLAGYSMEKNTALGYSMEGTNFPDDDILNDFPSAATRGALGESYTASGLISQFARLQYKYNNRYILSGTVRRDGSSRFGPDKRWGIFPSAAVAWLITEEDFMKNEKLRKVISYLKLRASTGKAGSQNLGDYDWMTRVGSSRYNENPAIAPNSIGNNDLQWEQTQMTDLGLDFGLWDERVRGSFGIYQKKTDKLIYSKPLPSSTSFNSVSSNVASLKNNGMEFDVSVDVLKRTDFTLTLDFNAARNNNRIMQINGVTRELNFPSDVTTYMKVKEGERTGQWFGYQTANRLFVTAEEVIALQGRKSVGTKQYYRDAAENPGDLYFIDQNGDGIINADDRVKLGSSDPKLFGGFGMTFFYKSFMINGTFTYAYGNKRLWSMPMDDAGYMGSYNHSNLIAGRSATLLSPYEASMPRITPYGLGENGEFSDFWLYDASYVRLSALNISYRLPEKMFKDKIIQGIDLTFQASNLFTLTRYPGFDPQGNWSSSAIGTGMGIDGSYYPSAKNYNLGIKFTFK
ncbi:SusC/RagA family TonB-linked outer membrane protein [Pedobacter sp. KBW06]|nr:SusC/RagA family TonB-linked outer membrane protein [Pedobacter sp. KBW06]